MTSDPYKDLPSLDKLQHEIDAAKGSKSEAKQGDPETSRGLAYAMRLSTELLAGVLVGGVLGYYLDVWLGTSPLFLIGCFFLGAAAGFRNIFRGATEKTSSNDNEGTKE